MGVGLIVVCGYLFREEKQVPIVEAPETPSETSSITPDRPSVKEAALLAVVKEILPMELIADRAEITPVPVAIEAAAALNRPDGDGKTDLEMVQMLITIFRRANDSIPYGGEHQEIVAGMLGHNPKKIAVIGLDHPAIADSGQLLDRWGTPYYFHPVSRTKMEIKSAGPDREFETDDDIEN